VREAKGLDVAEAGAVPAHTAAGDAAIDVVIRVSADFMGRPAVLHTARSVVGADRFGRATSSTAPHWLQTT
jgi:hypothetical protein